MRETLLEVAADSRHLGAQIGGLMVLHTGGQNLLLHPHVHVIVPGGGWTPNGDRWVDCPRGFFLPVKVLSRVFRGKLLAFVKSAQQAQQITFTAGLSHLSNPSTFAAWISGLYQAAWVVYSQPPCGGPEQVLKYLARYTYRVAISNDRLEQMTDTSIRFRYKDYTARVQRHGFRARLGGQPLQELPSAHPVTARRRRPPTVDRPCLRRPLTTLK